MLRILLIPIRDRYQYDHNLPDYENTNHTQGNCATEGNSGNCQSGERWMRKPSVHGDKWRHRQHCEWSRQQHVLLYVIKWQMICFQALWRTKSFVKVCLKFKLPLWDERPAHPPLPTMAINCHYGTSHGGIISLCICKSLQKSTLFMCFCSSAWCTGHNGGDPPMWEKEETLCGL